MKYSHIHKFYRTAEVKNYPKRFNFKSSAVGSVKTFRKYVCILCGCEDWREA